MRMLTMSRRAESRALLFIGILLIAACLRAPVTGLAPLLSMIQLDLGLSTVTAGALTTLPLLAFAVMSLFSARFARAYGLERALFGALVVMTLGVLLRSRDAIWCLYVGTLMIGVGIAVGNVLLPSLVKRDFPNQIASITGAYVLSMGIAAALGSAVVVPLAHAWGWHHALEAFLVFPLVALAIWITQIGAHTAPSKDTAQLPDSGMVWHSALAWQVALFLGINSTIYYVIISWLPTILVGAGFSPAKAGSLHGALQLATIVPALILIPIMGQMRDQRIPAFVSSLFSVAALLGFLVAPQWALVWAILFGMGTGAGIILGLAFISLRTAHAHQAATLSGMAQFVGYLLAAVAPMLMGALHDMLKSWSVPLASCAVLALIAAGIGLLAGRHRKIGD